MSRDLERRINSLETEVARRSEQRRSAGGTPVLPPGVVRMDVLSSGERPSVLVIYDAGRINSEEATIVAYAHYPGYFIFALPDNGQGPAPAPVEQGLCEQIIHWHPPSRPRACGAGELRIRGAQAEAHGWIRGERGMEIVDLLAWIVSRCVSDPEALRRVSEEFGALALVHGQRAAFGSAAFRQWCEQNCVHWADVQHFVGRLTQAVRSNCPPEVAARIVAEFERISDRYRPPGAEPGQVLH